MTLFCLIKTVIASKNTNFFQVQLYILLNREMIVRNVGRNIYDEYLNVTYTFQVDLKVWYLDIIEYYERRGDFCRKVSFPDGFLLPFYKFLFKTVVVSLGFHFFSFERNNDGAQVSIVFWLSSTTEWNIIPMLLFYYYCYCRLQSMLGTFIKLSFDTKYICH